MLQRQIENSFHLSSQIKTTKNECEKCLTDMESLIERLNMKINEFSLIQADHFENVRRDVDIKRETILNALLLNKSSRDSEQMIGKINEQSERMIKQVEMAEREFRQSFNKEIRYLA